MKKIETSPDRWPHRPLQFRLRTVFWAVTIASVAMAVVVTLSLVISAMFLLIAVLVAAHIGGNWVGTRLRGHAAHELSRDRPTRIEERSPQTGSAPLPRKNGRLVERKGIARLVVLIGIVGAVIGGGMGGLILALYQPGSATLISVAFGSLATAILGAFAAFLVASLANIVYHTVRDAHEET